MDSNFMKKKVAIITSHPIQYQAPLFRSIAQEPEIELTVFFGSDHGIDANKIHPGFGKAFAWDVPLLNGYRHVFLKNSRPGIAVNDWTLDGPALKFYFAKEHFDAVLVFGWDKILFWQAIWWGRKFGIPLIQRGESNIEHAQTWYKKLVKKVLFPLLFRQFKAFLSIGSLNSGLYTHFGVRDEAIFSAPYCVDNEYFSERSTAQKLNARQLRVEFGIRDGDTVFLFIAKFIDRKRPLDLIKAAAKIKSSLNCHVILLGGGPLMDACQQEINTHYLTNIHLVGFKNQSELPTYYAAADVFVLPSEYETWGLVVNEAMACGLPCIVSDACGAAVDMIIEGKTGFTYPAGKVDELARCMEHMVEHSEARREMGQYASKYVEHFSVRTNVFALKEALNYVTMP
jgi:glycosyltransferase involved in cell wall biosynthesis